MASAIILDIGRFYWNVDGDVGPRCPNKPEDVHLVQLGILCRATNPKNPPTPEQKAVFGLVVPGAPYTGAPNDPLSNAIRLFEKLHGGTQDGRVSKMRSTGHYDPKNVWLLVPLNNNIADVLGINWPRLDMHPKCTGALRELARRTFQTS